MKRYKVRDLGLPAFGGRAIWIHENRTLIEAVLGSKEINLEKSATTPPPRELSKYNLCFHEGCKLNRSIRKELINGTNSSADQ